MANKKLQAIIKRAIDIVVSLIALALLILPFILIFLAIKAGSKGPAFFKQERPGKNKKIFSLYKFRTMKDLKDKNGNLLPDAERLTKLGKFLRKLSLDELPEFLNVLKSDMSIVGPRPLLAKYLDLYSPEQARRHDVKPGITGWAQVKGRNVITWEEKFKCDIWYVANRSLWLDMKIIFMTIIKVIKGEGISQPGHATMEEFKGVNYEE